MCDIDYYDDFLDVEESKNELTLPTETEITGKIISEMRLQWKLPPENIHLPPLKPPEPEPTWERAPDGALRVKLPSHEQMEEYDKKIFYWKIKKAIDPPIAFVKNTWKKYNQTNGNSPRQISLHNER